MRRLLVLLSAILSMLPLAAERVMWYMPSEPGFTTVTGTFFLPDAFEGLSDTIPLGSIVHLRNTENGRECSITITGKLPEVPPGRTIALTDAAADALGIGSSGVTDAESAIIEEGTIGETEGNTGWYSYQLGRYENADEAYALYQRLEENGLSPYIMVKDGLLELSIRHIVAFRMSAVENLIKLSGIADAVAVMESNPYT